jgi:proteic killer suppression protein
MLVRFNNYYLQKLFESTSVEKKPRYSADVVLKFKKTILMLQYAENIRELRKLKGLNFEALKGNLKGYHSVRVNKKYRLIVRIEEVLITVTDIIIVEDLSNHYD